MQVPEGRLHIGVFNHSLPVVGKKPGGVDQGAHNLADGLARRGHKVTIWTHDPKPEGAAYEVRLLPWKRFVNSWLGRRVTMGYLGNILAFLPRYRDCDAIIAHGDSLLLPFTGKPLVRVMHGSALGEALTASSPLRFVSQLGLYPLELLTALTQRGCVGISRNTQRYNPFVRRVLPRGVDTRTFFPDPGAKTEEPSILFVGTLDGRKRGKVLLEWFVEIVRPRHPRATLFMVSSPGPPIDGVVYRSGVGPAEYALLCRQAWVYASPSVYEGLGLPYVEAMASGTPVIASPNPGSREVLDGGRYGILAEDADFGTRLADLLDDTVLRDDFTRRALERAQVYTLEAEVDAYEDLLLELVGKATQHANRSK